jgi:hypothetical protein
MGLTFAEIQSLPREASGLYPVRTHGWRDHLVTEFEADVYMLAL